MEPGNGGGGTYVWLKEQGIEAGFFLDAAPRANFYMGQKVYAVDGCPFGLKNHCIILVAVRCNDEEYARIENNLQSAGFTIIMRCPDGRGYMPCNHINEIATLRTRLLWAYDYLADDESRLSYIEYFRSVLARDFYRRKELDFTEKYFCADIFDFKAIKKFCCIGGYNGETVLRFIARNPDFDACLVIEPEAAGIKQMRHVFGFLPASMQDKISFIEKFAGSVSSGADNTVALDDCKFLPDLISLDIEGMELTALKGMCGIIKMARTVIALSAYHKLDDFPNFIEYVLSCSEQYNFFVRKYCAGKIAGAIPTNEIVLYAVPKSMLQKECLI